MRIIISFFILFFIFNLSSSCVPPVENGERLASGDRDDNDDDDDDDNGSNKRTTQCSDRDSCQDICDMIFDYSSERFECYDLHYSDVNTLTVVHDVFFVMEDEDDDNEYEVEVRDFNLRDLEDISSDDFSEYLKMGIETFIERVRDLFGDTDARTFFEWVVENEDIAEIILAQDSALELAHELFISSKPRSGIVGRILRDSINGYIVVPGPRATKCVDDDDEWYKGLCIIEPGEDPNTRGDHNELFISLEDFNGPRDRVPSFIDGFVDTFSNQPHKPEEETFIERAFDERNNFAFEWGHNALLNFCIEGTNADEEDIEVKQCMQAIYCITGKYPEDVFDELEDFEDIIGRVSKKACEYDILKSDRRSIERLFE